VETGTRRCPRSLVPCEVVMSKSIRSFRSFAFALTVIAGCVLLSVLDKPADAEGRRAKPQKASAATIRDHALDMVDEGQQTFRFDTFGDEAFWGDTIKLHQAIEGAALGGVGPGVSPKTALAVGLKVDVDALPGSLQSDLKQGRVNLDDPATTLVLLK